MVNEIISHKKKNELEWASLSVCARIRCRREWYRVAGGIEPNRLLNPPTFSSATLLFFLYSFSSPCSLTPSGRKRERKKSQPKCPPRRNQTRGRALEIRDGYGPFKKTTNRAIRHPIRPRSTYTIKSSLCMTTHRDIKKKNSFSVIRHTE
jgi:hypothetical protein